MNGTTGPVTWVLANYQSTGEPFSLFLSSCSFDNSHKAALSLLKMDPGNVQGRTGLERQVRVVLKIDDLEPVPVYRKGDNKRIARPEEWPALKLANEDWRLTRFLDTTLPTSERPRSPLVVYVSGFGSKGSSSTRSPFLDILRMTASAQTSVHLHT